VVSFSLLAPYSWGKSPSLWEEEEEKEKEEEEVRCFA
jgi:hypothetical protein